MIRMSCRTFALGAMALAGTARSAAADTPSVIHICLPDMNKLAVQARAAAL